MAKQQASYLQTRLRTATPEELTIITFDVLINSTTRAIAGLKKPILDIQTVHNDLRRGQRAAALLMGSLNFEIDDNLGRSLFRTYEYWHHELFMANMKKSPDVIEQLLAQMKGLRETWLEANRRYRAEKTANVSTVGGGFVAVG
jgi:flagellar biosynthetic protein FliS